jgi:YHS domain-containing protein
MRQLTVVFRVSGIFISILILSIGISRAQSNQDKGDKKSPTRPIKQGDVYPLGTCPISGSDLGSMGKPFILHHEGREFRFCCKGCVPRFEENPAGVISKIDKQIIKGQLDLYPVKYDLVTSEPFTEGSEPLKKVFQNRLVLFKDEKTIKTFSEDPGKYMKELDKLVADQQRPGYPVDTCIIMEDLLVEEEIIDFVHANKLFRFCCQACVKELRKKPLKYHAMLDKLNSKEGSPK